MKHVFCLLLAAGLLAGATSCNKSSFIEGVGAATNTTTSATATTGKITLYCTSYKMGPGSCNVLSVYVDSNYKGDLAGPATGTPQCGSNTKALTLELSPGSHSFSISGSSAGCPRYTFTQSVTKGACVTQGLN